MNFLNAAIGSMVNIVVICLFVAGVLRVFQIATMVGEVKELLQDIRRNTSGSYEAAGVARLNQARTAAPDMADNRSGDDMLRALDRQLNAGLDQSGGVGAAALEPEVVEPGDKSA